MAPSLSEEFRQKLKDLTRKAACGREYVLVHSLKAWLNDRRHNRVTRLIVEAFSNRRFDRDLTSLPGIENALLVFSILIDIDCAQYIDKLLRNDIVDSSLHSTDLKGRIQSCLEKNNVESPDIIAGNFDCKRWRFCPVEFSARMAHALPRERVLPIHRRELINGKGATADLWRIDVPEEFVHDELRADVAHSKSRAKDPSLKQFLFTFAVKTFKTGNGEYWESEKESFEGLEDHRRMIRYLGEFEHDFHYPSPGGNTSRSSTEPVESSYNIVLEYGNYDLAEYFVDFHPPVTFQEILRFWKDLIEIPQELRDLHNLKRKKGGKVREYWGWHADIKPDNILWVEGEFKLADPGFAMFIEKKDGAKPETEFKGGTQTFGAPECSPRKPRGKVTQAIDTWSLGCLLSIAATWVVLGFQGLMQFEIHRVEARAEVLKMRTKTNTVKTTGTRDDAFHDEEKVLDAVTIWHEYLRGHTRKSDIITPAILDLVDCSMLLQSPKERLSMGKLCDMLLKITEKAKIEGATVSQPPESVLQSLQQTDREASMKPLHEALAKVAERIEAIQNGRKLSSVVPLMKTSHRSHSTPSTGAGSSPRQMQIDSATSAVPPAIQESQESCTLAQAIDPSALRSNTTVTNSSIHRITIQEQIDAQKAQRGMRKLLSKLTAKPDKELEMWLKGRDIIILLDNGQSMTKHWESAVDIVELLVNHGTKFDDNGVDFYVTNYINDPNTSRKMQRDFSGIKRAMESAYPKLDYATDMPDGLGKLFQSNVADLMLAQRRGSTLRKMTFFILTDAKWEGTDNRDAVGDKIVAFVRKAFSILGDLEDRAVSIQFIQFGRDERSTGDLRKLDDELEQRGIPDVIDVERCDGDFRKMFLGSVNSKLDRLDTTLTADARAIAQPVVHTPEAMSPVEISPAVLPSHEKTVHESFSPGIPPSPSVRPERGLRRLKRWLRSRLPR